MEAARNWRQAISGTNATDRTEDSRHVLDPNKSVWLFALSMNISDDLTGPSSALTLWTLEYIEPKYDLAKGAA